MKKILKKLIIFLMIVVIINNFFIGASYAVEEINTLDKAVSVFTDFLGGIVGFLTWPLRITALLAGKAMNKIARALAFFEGAEDGAEHTVITPFDIFFNNVKLLDINFFEFDIGAKSNFITNLRLSIAAWYYVLRLIASAVLLVILIYVGIRMAISTVASDKAVYKRMLVDWVTSLAIIFVLHYIIIFTLTVNSSLVNVIKGVMQDTTDVEGTLQELFKTGKGIDIKSMGATVIYCLLVWQTFGLIITYFNRMMKIGFLIIISPLITITYSIDKMGDGKAQVLNAWLKEFIFTVLIQPFHAIIYLSLIDIAMKLVDKPKYDHLTAMIVAIVMIRFIQEAEKIVRKIFNFKDDNSKTSAVAAMATTGIMINQAKNLGKTTAKVAKGTVAIGKGTAKFAKDAQIELLALRKMRENADGKNKSFEERKEEARIELNNKEADSKLKNSIFTDEKIKEELKEKAQKLKDTVAGLTDEAALKQANEQMLSEQIDTETENVKKEHEGAISDEEARSIAKKRVAKKESLRRNKAVRAISGVKKKADDKKKYITNKMKQSDLGRKVLSAGETFSKLETPAVLAELGKEYLKASGSAGIGLMLGAGAYGAGQSLVASVAVGTAAASGINAELKNSSKGMKDRTRKLLGTSDANKARDRLNDINERRAEFGNGDKAKDKIKSILDELKAAMQNVPEQQREATISKIKNSITANPSAAPEYVASTLKSFGIDTDSGIGEKVIKYATDNAIFAEMENAESLQMDTTQFINNVTESYSETGPLASFISAVNGIEGEKQAEEQAKEEAERKEIKEKVNKITEADSKKKQVTIKNETKDLSDEQLGLLNAEFERRIQEELDKGEAERDDNLIEELRMEQAETITRAIGDSRRKLKSTGEKLLGFYQAELDQRIRDLDEELKNAKGKAVGEIKSKQELLKILNKKLKDKKKDIEKSRKNSNN